MKRGPGRDDPDLFVVGLLASYRKTETETKHLLKLARMRPNGRPDQTPPKKRAKQLNRNEIAEAARRYQAGEILRDIAAGLGVHRNTLSSRLVAAGVQIQNKGMDEQAVDEAKQRYEAGESLARIGEALGFSARTIRSYLLERGVTMRSTSGR